MIWNKYSSEWDELSEMGMVELESTAAATTSTPFKAEDHKLSPPRPLPLSTEHTNINQAQTLGNFTYCRLFWGICNRINSGGAHTGHVYAAPHLRMITIMCQTATTATDSSQQQDRGQVLVGR